MSSIKRELEQVSVDLEHVATKEEEKEYRTIEQFNQICDSFYNGNWSQAAIETVRDGFYQNDLIEHYEAERFKSGEDWDSDLRVLKGIVTIVEMAAEIRHAEICDFRPCHICQEWGTPLRKLEPCKKCVDRTADERSSEAEYELRVQELEAEGLTRSDAQGVVDAEHLTRKAGK